MALLFLLAICENSRPPAAQNSGFLISFWRVSAAPGWTFFSLSVSDGLPSLARILGVCPELEFWPGPSSCRLHSQGGAGSGGTATAVSAGLGQ